jgi:hypothetical protein
MAYFLINYLCATGAIVAWIVFSSEGWRRKIGITVIYLIVSAGLVAFIQHEGAALAKTTDGILGVEKDNAPVECRGALDEAEAGLRHIMVGMSDSLQAEVGRRLMLRGWISSYYSIKNPITVQMIPRKGGKPSLNLKVTQEKRPDLLKATHDPFLEQCGFRAECVLPQDLPLGKYQVVVQCRDNLNVDEFIPRCEVEVVSAQAGSALDAPLEQALAEQKAREAKATAALNFSVNKKGSLRHTKHTNQK